MTGRHDVLSGSRAPARAALHALALLCLTVVFLAGCSTASEEPEQVVLAYARGLEIALRGESLDGVRPYATVANVERVRLYVSQLAEDDRLVEARVQQFEIVSAEEGEQEGAWSVEVIERWSSVPLDDPGAETEVYEQLVRYAVVTVEGTLLVDRVEELGAP